MAHIPANYDPGGPQSGSLADALYKELWCLCAGPLVNLPREGERAFRRGTWSRTSRSPFTISLNKYLEAQSYRLSAGMKFNMRFEGEEDLEKGLVGPSLAWGILKLQNMKLLIGVLFCKKMVQLTELPLDVLSMIIIMLATSTDGAGHLARFAAVCEQFRQLANQI